MDGVNKTLTRVRYSYDDSNRLSKVTIDVTPDDGSIADNNTYVTTYTYDGTSKRVASLAQSDGTSLTFSYDASGRVTSVTNGISAVTRYAYDVTTGTTTMTDALGVVTTYQYDTSGRLTKIILPAVGGVSATRHFAYDSRSNLVNATDGESNTTVYGYDANGNQTLQRDALGNTVTRTYDTRNQLLSETVYLAPDPDGDGAQAPGTPLNTRHVYDSGNRNLLRFIVTAAGRVTEYRYDSFGQRTRSIRYAGNAYAGTVFGESDLEAWVLNTADKTQSERVDYTYDFRGQLATSVSYAEVDSSGNGRPDGAATTTYVYDQAGLLLRTIAPLGGAQQTTSHVYDGMGRILTSTNGLGEVTRYAYDSAGNSMTITAANGLKTVRTYDRAGRLVSTEQSGAQQWIFYDDAGRRTGELDSAGLLNGRPAERIQVQQQWSADRDPAVRDSSKFQQPDCRSQWQPD